MFRLFESLFEDKTHKSLGPVVTYLRFLCIWQKDRSKLKTLLFNIYFVYNVVFLVNVFIFMLVNFNLNNFYVYIQYSFANLYILKMYTYTKNLKKWYKVFQLVVKIENESLEQVGNHNKYVLQYRRYCHYVQIGFWGFGTIVLGLLIIAFWSNNVIEPILGNISEINPVVLYHVWLPVDPSSFSGQFWHTLLQTIFFVPCVLHIWGWDVMALSFMVFISGQLRALRERCVHALDTDQEELCMSNIIKCHQHYLNLQKCTKMLNDLSSSIMFMYLVMICINYGVAIVVLVETEKKFSVLYTSLAPVIGLMYELIFIYSIANEVIVQNENLMYGIFESDWTSKSVKVQRAVFMLSLGLRKRMALSAGLFQDMSLPAFINILRGIYSFYTLLSQSRN